jgi:predicted DNA-binding protein YlxM (UPF0122 family)
MQQDATSASVQGLNTPVARVYGKVNTDIAVFMAIQGKSVQEIAEHFGVTHQAISKHLSPLRDKIEQFRAFHEHPDMVYEQHEHRLLTSVADEDVKNMAPPQKYIAAGICRTKIGEIKGTGQASKPVIQINIQSNPSMVKIVGAIESIGNTVDIT